jgi:hypothetical protein
MTFNADGRGTQVYTFILEGRQKLKQNQPLGAIHPPTLTLAQQTKAIVLVEVL